MRPGQLCTPYRIGPAKRGHNSACAGKLHAAAQFAGFLKVGRVRFEPRCGHLTSVGGLVSPALFQLLVANRYLTAGRTGDVVNFDRKVVVSEPHSALRQLALAGSHVYQICSGVMDGGFGHDCSVRRPVVVFGDWCANPGSVIEAYRCPCPSGAGTDSGAWAKRFSKIRGVALPPADSNCAGPVCQNARSFQESGAVARGMFCAAALLITCVLGSSHVAWSGSWDGQAAAWTGMLCAS